MLPQINPNRRQRLQIKFLHILRRRLQNHLKLHVFEQPVRILPIPPIRRTPRRLHISDLVRIRSEHAQKRLWRHRSCPNFNVIRLLNHRAPRGVKRLQLKDEFLKRQRFGIG